MTSRSIHGALTAIAFALILLTSMLFAPHQAHAALRCMDVPDMEGDAQYTCFGTAANEPGFKGWAHVNSNVCMMSSNHRCSSRINAYRWDGVEWSPRNIGTVHDIYHWPWKNGWSWVWTKRTGWLATRRTNVLIYFTCTSDTGGRFIASECSTSSDLISATSLLAGA